MQKVIYEDLGLIPYKQSWDYQEKLLQENVRRKSGVLSLESGAEDDPLTIHHSPFTTQHYLLFVEHPPVYTLGKSGKIENALDRKSTR